MNKIRAVLTALLMVSILALAFPAGVLAIPPGDTGDCGSGYFFIARYDWNGSGYTFDSGWDVITFSPYLGVLNEYQGHWDSGSIVIDEVVFKDGTVVDNYHFLIPPPGSTFGDFNVVDFIPSWVIGNQVHAISHIDFCGLTTLITLDSFTASAGQGRVTLSWKTGAEVDNAGFNLYRSRFTDGTRGKVNSLMIAPKGDVSGASYSQTDMPGYGLFYYWLEDVDTSGYRSIHGPVQVLVLPALRRPVYRPSLPTQ